jgi:hypothetical protein
MKLNELQKPVLNEQLGEIRDDIKNAIDLLKDAKSGDEKDIKKNIDKAIDKLRDVRDKTPRSDLSYIGKIFQKILSLPLRFFGV